MAIRIQPAQIPAGEVPLTRGYVPDSNATFVRGDAVRIQTDSEVEIHPLTTTVINLAGFAAEDVTSGASDSPATEASIHIADRNTVWLGQVTASGAVVTSLSSINIDDTYGLLVVSGITYVDFDDTTNVHVQIVGKNEDLNIVFFKVLESVLQFA